MLWAFGFAVLMLALLIPILVVVLDSPAIRRRLGREGQLPDHRDEQIEELMKRVMILEDDVDDLSRGLDALRDDTQFLQQLLENLEHREPPRRLAPPNS
ncbi:MAG: hypothetical protein GTO22_02945 [Gemmatimonadales bacterium]|nr:hypothetical protein [Gemmatimonadales bacterium]